MKVSSDTDTRTKGDGKVMQMQFTYTNISKMKFNSIVGEYL